MQHGWIKLVHLLRLARVEMIAPLLASVWLMVFLQYVLQSGAAPWSFVGPLLLTGVIAVGLGAYGAALNDVLDVRHDRAFAPTRPIPAGHVAVRSAVYVAIGGLLAAVLAAVLLGTYPTLLVLCAAALILTFNAAGKHFPAIGIAMLGAIHALLMLIPAIDAPFLWPVWFNMTHVMFWGAMVHRLESKRPRLHGDSITWLVSFWLFATLALLGWMNGRQTLWPTESSIMWAGPIAALVLLVAVGVTRLRPHLHSFRQRRAAARQLARLAMLWLILCDAGWLLAGRHWGAGLTLLALFAMALATSQAISALAPFIRPPAPFRLPARSSGASHSVRAGKCWRFPIQNGALNW